MESKERTEEDAMKLNLTMVSSRLRGVPILSRRCNKLARASFSCPVFYEGGDAFREDVLYIARGADLPKTISLPDTVSLCCIGPLPPCFRDSCEYLCFPEDCSFFSLFNQVQAVFTYFSHYDEQARGLSYQANAFHQLGELAFSLLGNPVSLYDSHDKLLVFSYDSKRPPYSPEYMQSVMTPGKYMPEEEWQQLHTFCADTFLTDGVQYASNDIYAVDCLYVNLRYERQYLGRFMIDSSYGPFRDADYSILAWLSKYFRQLLLQGKELHFGKSRQFNRLLQNLTLSRLPYRQEFDNILLEEGWERYDTYICTWFTSRTEFVASTQFSGDALYLSSYFDSHCILPSEPNIVQIFNLSKSQYSLEQYQRRVNLFLKFDNNYAGSSTCFFDLADCWLCSQQAKYALEQARSDQRDTALSFNDCVLDMMLSNIRSIYSSSFFQTDAVQTLLKYDIENNTELLATLRCYLENNMNYSHVQEQLHIARTTALYRISRVREITGLDLDNPKNRLYLLIFFRLMSTDS